MQTFEIGELPYGIYRFLLRNNRRVGNLARENNHYWVTDICKCLRQSYYELSNTPSDAERKEENEAEHLWCLQSAKYLHNLTSSYRWRELDIEKEILFQDIDEKLYIHGRLDMYDYKTLTIIDLKTTNAVKWQYEKRLIPRERDIHQLQCYRSMFDGKLEVANLILLYADMKNLITFKVPVVNKLKWIEDRILQLHLSVTMMKSPPQTEGSVACDYCKFKKRCDSDSKGYQP
jgi:CRISPR/Cas system-associated exonuclease Cas4 (RecB family)